MASPADVLAQARSELGYVEGNNNSNKFAREAGHANNQPWCATFVVAMFRRVGIKLPSESAYTPTMADGFKKTGTWHKGPPSPGDVVFFYWPSMGRIAHVGIVEYISGGIIFCLEGNTNTRGSRTGGMVCRQARTKDINGYGRPKYEPSQSSEEEELMGVKDEVFSHITTTSANQAQSHRVVSMYGQLHRFEINEAGELRHQFYDPKLSKWFAEVWAEECDPNGKVDVIPEYAGAMHVFADHGEPNKVVHVWYSQKGGRNTESIPR